MKNKLNLALVAIAAVMIFCGCERNAEQAKPFHGGIYEIDTLVIHGEPHEIISERSSHQGGIMHSPECWCGKGSGNED